MSYNLKNRHPYVILFPFDRILCRLRPILMLTQVSCHKHCLTNNAQWHLTFVILPMYRFRTTDMPLHVKLGIPKIHLT